MFFLDKLVLKYIITKCAELGGVFMLGAFEGALLYLGIFGLGIVIVMESGKKK